MYYHFILFVKHFPVMFLVILFFRTILSQDQNLKIIVNRLLDIEPN